MLTTKLFPPLLLILTACKEPQINPEVRNFAEKIFCLGTQTNANYSYTFGTRFSENTDEFETTKITFRDYTYSPSKANGKVGINDSLDIKISNEYATPSEEWFNLHLDGFSIAPEIIWNELPNLPSEHNILYLTQFSPSYRRFTDLEERTPEIFLRRIEEWEKWLIEDNPKTTCDLYDTGENI